MLAWKNLYCSLAFPEIRGKAATDLPTPTDRARVDNCKSLFALLPSPDGGSI